MSFSAPCFQALTRPIIETGLPLTYVVILAMTTMGGFIATLSFVYFAASAIIGSAALSSSSPWVAGASDAARTMRA